MFRVASFTLRHISGMAAGFWWHMCSSDDDDGKFGILAFGDAILGPLLLHLDGSMNSDRFKNGICISNSKTPKYRAFSRPHNLILTDLAHNSLPN